MFDIAFRGNRVLTPEGLKSAVVLVKNGIIEEVLPYNAEINAQTITELGESVLMAGLIDPHVHINEPGRTNWEGFDTATKAALAGGLTTLIDMPLNSSPVTTNVASLEAKRMATQNQLHTNCGFWGGLVPGNTADIEGLIENGVIGFKAFLTHSGIDEFPNVTEEDLRKTMPVIARHQLPLLVHCEISTENNYPPESPPESYSAYLASRPKEWEDKAIELMIRLCEEFGCRTHIVHLSSSNSVEPIKKAKEKGLPLTVETAQHYLYFNAENIPDRGTQYKCAPPIREKSNNDQLWQALKDGIIDFVATDHSPAPPELKLLEEGNFKKAWGGISSIQFALPILWTAARDRGFQLTDIADWLSEKPAKLIGKADSLGKIQKGYTADLLVWNPEKDFEVTETLILHKHKITPYLHEKLYGLVEQTYLKGKKVFENGNIVSLNSGEIV